jgi:uncharacterized protein YgbK (DUF1537 family)
VGSSKVKTESGKDDLASQFKSYKLNVDSQLRELKKEVRAIRTEALRIIRKNNSTVVDIYRKVNQFEAILAQLGKSNETVEETLCNVLLAIKQNQYLQAWYPAQKGYPEMMVVGPHPSKLDSKE